MMCVVKLLLFFAIAVGGVAAILMLSKSLQSTPTPHKSRLEEMAGDEE